MATAAILTAKAAARMVSTADPLIPGADHGTCTFGLGASRKGSGAADCARVSTFIDRREQDREFPAVSFGRQPFLTLRPLLSAVTRWGAAMSVREQAMTGPVRVNILLVDDQPARKAPEL